MNSLSHGIGRQAVPAGLMKRVKVFLERSAAERQLNMLDDRMLSDIGIKRGEIQRAVWSR